MQNEYGDDSAHAAARLSHQMIEALQKNPSEKQQQINVSQKAVS